MSWNIQISETSEMVYRQKQIFALCAAIYALFHQIDGRKLNTRRGVIVASTPVLGLRPILAFLLDTENVPKRTVYLLACLQAERDFFQHRTTSWHFHYEERPICWCTAFAKSLRVSVLLIKNAIIGVRFRQFMQNT